MSKGKIRGKLYGDKPKLTMSLTDGGIQEPGWVVRSQVGDDARDSRRRWVNNESLLRSLVYSTEAFFISRATLFEIMLSNATSSNSLRAPFLPSGWGPRSRTFIHRQKRHTDVPHSSLRMRLGDVLITSSMIPRMRSIMSWFRWLLRSCKPGAGRPRLVGMYLKHANDPERNAQRLAGNHERRDGKFAQKRQRG